jgi:non-heme chloroperoxidase
MLKWRIAGCGFGRSSQPSTGHDYDTFAADLDKLLTTLNPTGIDLAEQPMGGGEITRYLATFGSSRVRKAAIVSGIPPRQACPRRSWRRSC